MEVLKGMGNLRGYVERKEALKLWSLLNENKLSELARNYFDETTADVYFNTSSGNVFLSDEDCNIVMERKGQLDLFIYISHSGQEGFFDELMNYYEDMHEEDKKYLREIATETLKEKYPILKEEEE